MTKHSLINHAALVLVAALGFGCAAASKTVEGAATVDVGAESLQAVEIDRSITLGIDRIPTCLDFSATLPPDNTLVALSNGPMGCTLTLEQPDLVLLDQQAIERARKQAGDFDVSGIRSGSLQMQKFALSTADGSSLMLSQYVDAVSITLDGEVLLDRVAVSELESSPLTREMPQSVIEKLKGSLKDNQAATADVVIALWLRGEGLTDLPSTLSIRVVLQPELHVNLIDATL